MPTGYTAAVQDGKITTLREFAMQCARAFGACVTMRDDPWNAPIPEEFAPNTAFYDERIAAARSQLVEINLLSARDREMRAAAEYAEAVSRNERYIAEKTEQRQRYEAMLAKVMAWEVPADLTEMRSFMIDQLTQSIDIDCSVSYLTIPAKLSGEEWAARTLARLRGEIAHSTERRDKEIERTAGRNKWLRELRECLAKAEQRSAE